MTPQLLHFQRTPVNSSNTAGPTRCDVSVRFYKKKEERKQPVYVPATLPEHWAESCKLRENNGDVFKSKLILGVFFPPTSYRWLLMTLLGELSKVILIITMPPPLTESTKAGVHAALTQPVWEVVGFGGGGGGVSEKMTPYAPTMQHSLSSVSDPKKKI